MNATPENAYRSHMIEVPERRSRSMLDLGSNLLRTSSITGKMKTYESSHLFAENSR